MGDESERTSADQATLDAASDAFQDYAKQFENTLTPLGAVHDGIVAGAGELTDDVSLGAAKFLLAWRETLQACSETSGIIAGNIGNYWLDLTDVDIDNTVTITI